MKEFDFSQLQSFKTPGEWIENALKIPNKKNNSTILHFRSYLIGTAASVVIVTAVALTLLLHTDFSNVPSQPPSALPAAVTENTKPSGNALTAPSLEKSAPTVSEAPKAALPTASSTVAAASASVPPSSVPPVTAATAVASVAAPPTSSKPSTQAPAVPLTTPLTTPLTEGTSPGEAASPGTLPTQPLTVPYQGEIFCGKVFIFISEKNPLYQSTYITASVSSCGTPQKLKPQTNADGVRCAVFQPSAAGMTLYNGCNYQLRIYDTNGSESRAWFTPTGGGNAEIHFS